MPTDQSRVFERPDKVRWQINGERWVDLYALLNVPHDAKRHEIEDAIIERGADLVVFSFARGGDSELVRAIKEFNTDFRPILLDPAAKRRYDELLKKHEAGRDAEAFSVWIERERTLSSGARMARRLRETGLTALERIKRNIRENEIY